MKKVFLLLIILLNIIYAVPKTLNILNLPIGAASIRSGNGAIITKSSESVYINPAFINFMQKYQIDISYANLSFDRSNSFISLILQNKDLKIGLSLFQFKINDIEERDLNGKLLSNFSDNIQKYSITIGKQSEKINFGFSFSYIKENVYKQNASAITFNIGIAYQLQHNVIINYSLRNFSLFDMFSGKLSSKLKWKVDLWSDKQTRYEFEIPYEHILGITKKIPKTNIFIGISYHITPSIPNKRFYAIAYKLNNYFNISYSYNNDYNAMGFSLKNKILNKDFLFNYSFCKENISNEYLHYFTWTILFNK